MLLVYQTPVRIVASKTETAAAAAYIAREFPWIMLGIFSYTIAARISTRIAKVVFLNIVHPFFFLIREKPRRSEACENSYQDHLNSFITLSPHSAIPFNALIISCSFSFDLSLITISFSLGGILIICSSTHLLRDIMLR